MHERTASAIERLYHERLEDQFSALAHHYRRSANAPKAVHYMQLAAAQAISRGAYVEAASAIDEALKLLDALPDDSERLRIELGLRDTEGGVAFVRNGASSPERSRAIERMCVLGEKLGEKNQLLRALVNLTVLYFTRGEALRALEVGKRWEELVQDISKAPARAMAHFVAGLSYDSCGYLNEAVSRYKEAIFHVERSSEDVYFPMSIRSGAPACLCA